MTYRLLAFCTVLASACFLTCTANADLVVFNFATGISATNGVDLDGLAAGTTVSSSGTGITLTLSATALVDGSTGTLNAASTNAAPTNFGINASGSDVSDGLDDEQGAESILFSVTSNVPLSSLILNSVDLDRVTPSGEDAGSLAFTGGTTFSFTDATLSGSDLLTANEAITTSQQFTLAWVGGNGFGLETITFNAVAAVPEPSSLALLGLVGLAGVVRRRK